MSRKKEITECGRVSIRAGYRFRCPDSIRFRFASSRFDSILDFLLLHSVNIVFFFFFFFFLFFFWPVSSTDNTCQYICMAILSSFTAFFLFFSFFFLIKYIYLFF